MPFIVLLVLLIVIRWDSRLLKRSDEALFKEIFQVSNKKITIFLLVFFFVISLVLISLPEGWEAIPFFIIIFVLPIYILRRSRFEQCIKGKNPLWMSIPADKSLLVLDALKVVMIWFYSVVMATFFTRALTQLFPPAESELGELLIVAGISSAIVFILIYQASQKFSQQGFLTNIGLRRGNQSLLKVVILPAVIGLIFAYLSALILFNRQIQPVTPLSEAIEATQSSLVLLGFLVMAILLAPLIEEIIFRGYFFHVISKVKGKIFAIYFIALTFAFLHVGQYWGDWAAIGMVTLLGFILTLFRAWTQTTIASVVIHYVYNGGVTIIPVIMMIFANPAYFEYKVNYFQHDSAVKEKLLKESIHKQPDLSDAYNDLAWLYSQENIHLDEALELIEKALSIEPEAYAYLDTKAEVLFKLGRYREALSIREDLLERDLSEDRKDYQLQKIEEIKHEEIK